MAFPTTGCNVVCTFAGGSIQRPPGKHSVGLVAAPFAWSKALTTGQTSPAAPKRIEGGDPLMVITPFSAGWLAFSTDSAVAPDGGVDPRLALRVEDGWIALFVQPGTRVTWVAA